MTIGTPDGKSYECEMRYQLGIPSFADQDEAKDLSRSSESKKIYFVRHGEPHMIGWAQTSLNDSGRKDAQKAAESAADLPIEHIVSSDLPRAAETARIIGNRNNLPIEYDPGLRTWNLGKLNGPPDAEKEKEIDRLCTTAHDEVPEGGESFNQFYNRILSTISGIIKRHNDKEIMIVSHSSPGKVLNAYMAAGQPKKSSPSSSVFGAPWMPGEMEEQDKIQGAPSSFRKNLDPNLKGEDFIGPLSPNIPMDPNIREELSNRWMEEGKRDWELNVQFPDAFPMSSLQKDLGIYDVGNHAKLSRLINQLDAEEREKHRQKGLEEQLGIKDIGRDKYRDFIERLNRIDRALP